MAQKADLPKLLSMKVRVRYAGSDSAMLGLQGSTIVISGEERCDVEWDDGMRSLEHINDLAFTSEQPLDSQLPPITTIFPLAPESERTKSLRAALEDSLAHDRDLEDMRKLLKQLTEGQIEALSEILKERY